MLKKFFIVLFASLLMIGICGKVLAVDTQTATSTINGVTVNWEYEVNESNQIENLKCTNPTDLAGNITIPSTLDGKTVISLKNESFKGANITGLTIPNTLKSIGYGSFSNCANLSSINLGQLEKISFDVFKNCPKLTTVTIPKTLISGPTNVGGVFTGTTNLTSVTFENGLTQIPDGILRNCTGITKVTIPSSVTKINECAFQNSGLTEITIPSSVKEIDFNAFQDCANLSSVNLGQLEKISFDVFKNCPKLTTVTIPKTLISGPTNVGGVFTGTTNLTSVTFENGITQIPDGILRNCTGITKVTIPSSVTKINECVFQNSGLTEITIPSSVKEIDFNAFQDCANLSIVNLGQLEKISFDVFKNCPKLTTVTIPKTLISGPTNVGGVFTGTTNLTSVTFENGLTQIPDGILRNCTSITKVTIPSSVTKINECAFQNSGLTEITIPSSVKEIDFYAFKDCEKLEKTTILNEETKMGWFTSQPQKDSVFENHNQNLTIYCYKDSIAAKYAIANNIKYVYLTKPTTDSDTDKKDEQNQQQKPSDTPNTNQEPTKKDDTTIATGKLPQAGATITGLFIILIISIASIIFYMKYRKFRDIK